MLNGLYIIDGVDIWETYSAVILKGSYNSLLSYPTRKTPDYDDWFEHNFIDVDYSKPFFEANDVALKVGIYGSDKADLLTKIRLFKIFLNKSGERIFNISGINKDISLRYKGGSNAVSSKLSTGNQFYLEQDLIFSNDKPIQLLDGGSTFDYTFDRTFRSDGSEIQPTPYDYLVWNNFDINGIPVINFGMGVTSFNASSLVFDTLKEPLQNTYINKNGIDAYVSDPLKYKAKTLTVGLVMAHSNVVTLMNNYSTLFSELAKSTPISITNTITDYTYTGFYLNQDNLNVSISGNTKILEFNIDLTITQITDNG